MKVLFTGCTFDSDTKEKLNNIGIEVDSGRMDYSEEELINKEDLYNTIINNKVGFVAMDGFYDEPITKNTEEKYLELPNDKYIITPHNAYNSTDAVKEMERMLIESLTDLMNNDEIRNRV